LVWAQPPLTNDQHGDGVLTVLFALVAHAGADAVSDYYDTLSGTMSKTKLGFFHSLAAADSSRMAF
jgi:pyruvate carboxylase